MALIRRLYQTIAYIKVIFSRAVLFQKRVNFLGYYGRHISDMVVIVFVNEHDLRTTLTVGIN